MRFSFILPVKNGGDYIKQCVQSILVQTNPDFNLHILENKSTDGTAEWLQTLTDERIIIIPAETSLNIEENWARIVKIHKNEFITITGHDDLFDANYLEVMNNLINQHPSASLYQTHFRFIDAKGNFIKYCRPMDEKQNAVEFLHSLFIDSIDTMGTGYMMRSKDYDAVGGIPAFPNLLFADHALWIKLTALSYKVTFSAEKFSYRYHENVSKNANAACYINAFYNYMDFLVELKIENNQLATIIESYVSNYILYYCRSLAHRLLKTPVKERKGMSVAGFINNCIKYNDRLSSNREIRPLKQSNILVAKLIDENIILQKIYLLLRKFYKRPVYS